MAIEPLPYQVMQPKEQKLVNNPVTCQWEVKDELPDAIDIWSGAAPPVGGPGETNSGFIASAAKIAIVFPTVRGNKDQSLNPPHVLCGAVDSAKFNMACGGLAKCGPDPAALEPCMCAGQVKPCQTCPGGGKRDQTLTDEQIIEMLADESKYFEAVQDSGDVISESIKDKKFLYRFRPNGRIKLSLKATVTVSCVANNVTLTESRDTEPATVSFPAFDEFPYYLGPVVKVTRYKMAGLCTRTDRKCAPGAIWIPPGACKKYRNGQCIVAQVAGTGIDFRDPAKFIVGCGQVVYDFFPGFERYTPRIHSPPPPGTKLYVWDKREPILQAELFPERRTTVGALASRANETITNKKGLSKSWPTPPTQDEIDSFLQSSGAIRPFKEFVNLQEAIRQKIRNQATDLMKKLTEKISDTESTLKRQLGCGDCVTATSWTPGRISQDN